MGLALVSARHGDEGIEDRSLDEDGVHRVGADVPLHLRSFEGDRLGVHPHPGLGGVIGAHARCGGQARHRRDVDDRSRRRGAQVRHGVLAAEHDRAKIDLVLALPVLGRVGLDEHQRAADTGVVHQHGQAAHIRAGAAGHVDPLLFRRDIVGVGEGGAGPACVDLVRKRLDGVGVDVGQGQFAALGPHDARHGRAQAAGRAGDQGLFVRQTSGHHCPPIAAAASSMKRARSRSRCVTPPASWVVNSTSTRL